MSDEHGDRMTMAISSRGNVTWIIVRALLAGGVLWLLFSFVDPSVVLESMATAHPLYVLAAFLLVPVHLVFRLVRWRTFLATLGQRESLLRTITIVLAGYPFSAVTPGEVGDVFVRSRYRSGGTAADTAAMVLLDKATQGVFIVVGGVPSLVFVTTASWTPTIASFLIICTALALLYSRRRSILHIPYLQNVAVRLRLDGALETLRGVPRSAALRVAVFALMTLVTFAAQEYLLLRSLADISFSIAWLGYWSVITAQLVFPFFLAGLGIREGAHVYFFGLLGVSAPAALSASLLMFCVNVLIPSLIGLCVFLFIPRSAYPEQ